MKKNSEFPKVVYSDYISLLDTPKKPMRSAYEKMFDNLSKIVKNIEELAMRDAFMAGYTRKETWEEYQRRTGCSDDMRATFMAGYTRSHTWEQW